MTRASVRYVRTQDDLDIAYQVMPGGPGTPVLFVPPIPAVSIELQPDYVGTSQSHIGEDRDVIVFDRRGTGASQRGADLDYSPAGLSLDLLAIGDALGLERVSLLATGSGCYAALAFAHRFPERTACFVVQTLAGYRGGVAGGDPATRAILEIAAVDWEEFTELWPVHLAGSLQRAAELARPAGPTTIRESQDQADFLAQAAALAEVDLTPLLPEIAAPAAVFLDRQILRGRLSGESRQLAAALPAGELIMGAGRGEDVQLATAQFLRRHDTSSEVASAPHSRASGFQTILFTDVVSSTPLLSQLRDERMRAVMRDHDAVCEAAIAEHGGRVVKTIGDAFMAEFSVPSAAIEAAIAIQRGIRERFADSDVPIRLRIGINAGEPIVEDEDLHGASVVIAKRLESEADANGILVSDVVRQAVAGKDFTFEDRGEVELKGFDQPVRAWAVRWAS